jgi:molecular chaperone DnaK
VPYSVGVDLGTTYTAAAVWRDGHVEVSTLGTSAPTLASVVLLRADGSVLVGEAAERRGVDEPNRVAREFKRRLGDPTPLILGGTPYGAEALMGHLLRSVLAIVTEREGEPPGNVVLTHPVNYGPYKIEMVHEAARLGGLNMATTKLLPEPVAAAVSYANRQRVEVGEIFAVYDFGGGTFDAAVLRRTAEGFQVIGRPEGMERLGGIDVDAALVAHVDESLGGKIADLDPTQPEVLAGMTNLRVQCREAKEALSSDTDAVVRVSLPGVQTNVRITRAELEQMIRPRIVETVESLRRTVESAGIPMDRISRILLVGGSSRIPLVAELVQQATGRPVALDAHPKFSIATGAAIIGGSILRPSAATAPAAPAAPAAGRPGQASPPQGQSPPPGVRPLVASGPTAPTQAGPGHTPQGQIPQGQIPQGQMPQGQMPPGQMPRGEMPRGEMPPGQMPRGEMPRGQMPRGEMPRGQMPPGQMPQGRAGPQGQMPPGQMPPGQMPQGQWQPGQQRPTTNFAMASPGGVAPPTSSSRRNLYIGLGVAAALIIAIVAFVASRGDNNNSLAGAKKTDAPEVTVRTTKPVATTKPPAAVTAAPTAAPATAAPVTPPPLVDAVAIHGALLQPSDLLGAGWASDTLTSTDNSLCGQLPKINPVTEDQSVMSQNPNTAQTVGVTNDISAYASAADAKSAFEEAIAIVKSCPVFTLKDPVNGNETQQFQVIESPLPTCDQSGTFRVDTTLASNGAVVLTVVSAYRCGNIISSVAVQQLRPADGLLPKASIDLGNDALQKSFKRVSVLPRRT